jgi:hypothetical protein
MVHIVMYYKKYFFYSILMNNLNELNHFQYHLDHHMLNYLDVFRFDH